MADTTNTKAILSVCATVANRLPDLEIKNGNLIFVRDIHRVALDFDDKRVFYNQIEELATEADRKALLAPVTGLYYFVIDTAVLWAYQNGWIQITTSPQDIVYIGTEMPELGSARTLYVDKANRNISIWDDATSAYVIVGETTEAIEESYIDSLFNQ